MGIHDGHRKRMKGEFLARPDSFPDHKLLEMLLFYANPRSDTNPTAHALMERFGSLSGVLDASPDDLCQVAGVGEHAAVLLKLTKEFGRRYLTGRTDAINVVNSVGDMIRLFRPYFYGLRSERFCLLCMDSKYKVLGVRAVCEGSVDNVDLSPRDVVAAALSLGATRVVLAHNHPSGVALPSASDQSVTETLKSVLSGVSVRIVDHLIFSDDDVVSMAQSGFDFRD